MKVLLIRTLKLLLKRPQPSKIGTADETDAVPSLQPLEHLLGWSLSTHIVCSHLYHYLYAQSFALLATVLRIFLRSNLTVGSVLAFVFRPRLASTQIFLAIVDEICFDDDQTCTTYNTSIKSK